MYVCVLMAADGGSNGSWCDEGSSGTCRSCSAGGGCMQQWFWKMWSGYGMIVQPSQVVVLRCLGCCLRSGQYVQPSNLLGQYVHPRNFLGLMAVC
jgi:hypothetical protein